MCLLANASNAIEKCVPSVFQDPFKKFGPYQVSDVQHLDGSKFYLGGSDRWVMIRPSGTEPVLRVYAQAENAAEVRKILDAAREEMGI